MMITQADITAIKRVNPTSYLQTLGFHVRQDGRKNLSARKDGQEVYRLTLKNGAWVACRKDGQGVGDIISLVQELESCNFPRAFQRLGAVLSRPLSLEEIEPKNASAYHYHPQLPKEEGVTQGQTYLRRRGIEGAVLEHAHQTGFLRYVRGAVLFVGYDEKAEVRSVTRRGYLPQDPRPKRDLAGSDKAYPAILSGTATDHVWIVEGGVDALALQSLAQRADEPTTPPVIVTGGVGSLRWLDSPSVQNLLQAPCVCISAEWEKDEKRQVEAETRRAKWLERLPGAHVIYPPRGKDVADFNHLKTQDQKRGGRCLR